MKVGLSRLPPGRLAPEPLHCLVPEARHARCRCRRPPKCDRHTAVRAVQPNKTNQLHKCASSLAVAPVPLNTLSFPCLHASLSTSWPNTCFRCTPSVLVFHASICTRFLHRMS